MCKLRYTNTLQFVSTGQLALTSEVELPPLWIHSLILCNLPQNYPTFSLHEVQTCIPFSAGAVHKSREKVL